MDEDLNTPQMANPTPPSSFSSGARPKNGSKKTVLIVLIIAAILLIGGGIYFLVTGGDANQGEATPTPELSVSDTPVPEASPEETSGPIDREGIEINVLNGTGIEGEASFLKTKLDALGYEGVTAGNASSQNSTDTVVTFKSGINAGVKTEITDLLEDTYQKVSVKTSSSQTKDVEIVTGLRKGATSKPTATKTPTPKSSPTGTPKGSPTATPKASVTPTPTL